MKRILLFFNLVFLAVALQANPVDPSEARDKAQAFFLQRGVTMAETSRPYQAPLQGKQQACSYYVFNADNGKGFVLISGDDRTPEILGYSTQGTFDYDEVPGNVRGWLDDYARQIAWLQAGETDSQNALQRKSDDALRSVKVAGMPSIPTLIASRWNQGFPYNDRCPIIDSQKAPTGCVATAMAQLLYYHYRGKGTTYTVAEIPAYVSKTCNISMPAIGPYTPINWNVLKDTYAGGQYTAESKDEIAKLMLLCGTSLEMNYTPEGSGAYDSHIPRCLNDYFGFENNLRCIYRNNISEAAWDSLVYDELSHSRPVVYSGSSSSNSGHCFIIDGFEESTKMFHVNWGWGGHYDGYYRLSALTPNGGTGSGYNYDQSANLTIENDEYYDYWQNRYGFTVRLKEGFRHALDNNTSYAGWEYGTPLPAPKTSIATITDMSYSNLFDSCMVEQLDLSNYDTENVTYMRAMFQNCKSLRKLDISGFNTENVTDMAGMFYGCNSLASLDFSGFNTAKVTNMRSMFCNCILLSSLDVSGFNTENVTDMGWMFYGCKLLRELDVSGFNTAKVTNMKSMFYGCRYMTSLDVSGFNTENVTDMPWMFANCNALSSLDVSGFNTAKVTDMYRMFYNCNYLTSLDASNFNTEKVSSMGSMFERCYRLKELNLTGFDLTNVTDKENMFYYTSSNVTVTAEGYAKNEETVRLLETGTGINTSKLKFRVANNPNAILPVFSENPDSPVYNMSGQRQNRMQRGINIVKGAKYVVRPTR